jgi:hypothetical protein
MLHTLVGDERTSFISFARIKLMFLLEFEKVLQERRGLFSNHLR